MEAYIVSFPLIIILPLLLLPVLGLALGLRKAKRPWLIALAIIPVVLVFLFAGVFFIRHAGPQPWQQAIVDMQPTATETREDEYLQADVYPSARPAALAACRSLLDSLEASTSSETAPTRVELAGNIEQDILVDLAHRIVPYIGRASVNMTDSPASQPCDMRPDTIALIVDRHPPGDETSVRVTMRTHSTELERYANVRLKPWAIEDGNLSTIDPDHPVVTSGLEPSDGAARQRAIAAAVETLLPRAIEQTHFAMESFANRQERREWLRSEITQQLYSGRLIADRFTQEFKRPYGSVFKCKLQLDASPAALEPVIDKCCNVLAANQTRWSNTIFGGLGLVLLVCVVYLFLNAATKGYYTRTLQVLGVLAVIVGVFVVLRLA